MLLMSLKLHSKHDLSVQTFHRLRKSQIPIRTILSWSTIPKTDSEIQAQLSRPKSAAPPLPRNVVKKQIVIQSLKDNWPLAATVFHKEGWENRKERQDGEGKCKGNQNDNENGNESENEKQNVVVIGSATGVPASFYHPFAAYLASQGSPTICFDYRLCGESFPPSSDAPSIPTSGSILSLTDRNEILKLHPSIGFEIWGTRDYASVLLYAFENLCPVGTAAGEKEKKRGLSILGSSLGGHLFPLALETAKKTRPDDFKVDRALFYSSINPWHGFTSEPESTRKFSTEMLSWIARDGFQDIMKWSLGHNIPSQAGLDWISASLEPNYTGSTGFMKESFNNYRTDTLAISFSDDHLAHGSPRRSDGFNRILGWADSVESEEERKYWEMEGDGDATGGKAYLRGQPPNVLKGASEQEASNRKGWLNTRVFLDVEENGWIKCSKGLKEGESDSRPREIGHVNLFKHSVGKEESKSREVWELVRHFLQKGKVIEKGDSRLGGRGGRRDFGI